jgi:hypothetical protein
VVVTAAGIVLAVALGSIVVGIVVGKMIALGNRPPHVPPSRLTVNMDAAAAQWRTIRAADCIDEALAADARDASEVGDLAALHNIAITRTVVGELRDRMASA